MSIYSQEDKWLEKNLLTFELPESAIHMVGDEQEFLQTFGAPHNEVAKSLTAHLCKIPEISSEMKVTITNTDYGASINIESDGLTFQMKYKAKDKNLYFHMVTVDDPLQGAGVVKEAFRGVLDTAKNNPKVEKLSLLATLEVGGYAWAKYGFQYSDCKFSNKQLIQAFQEKMTDGTIVPEPENLLLAEQLQEVEKMLANGKKDPMLLWDIADLKTEVTVKDYLACPDHPLLPQNGVTHCKQKVFCRKPLNPNEESWECPDHGLQTESIPSSSGRLCREKRKCKQLFEVKNKKRLALVLLQGSSWDGEMPLGDSDGCNRLKSYIKY